ncbi:MAG: putative Ig domain-containing protein [Pseudomonadota bacterium]
MSNRFSRVERVLRLFAPIRPGEGQGIVVLALNAFLLLTAYYIFKTLREALILSESGAVGKSVATGLVALVLIFLVPLYGVVFRHTNRTELVYWVNAFFLTMLACLFAVGLAGGSVAMLYYVWVGLFGVMVIAQFWAYATDIYNVKSGQRVFPIAVAASSIGALAGSWFSQYAFTSLAMGPYGLMIIASVLCILSTLLYRPARYLAPEDSRCIECEYMKPKGESLFGGFAVVWGDQYLRLLALFTVMLNWINSSGEFILAQVVEERAREMVQAGLTQLSVEQYVGAFYGSFSFAFNALGLLLQLFVVSRLLKAIGLRRALLILPVLVVLSYSLILFIPIFSLIRLTKVVENGVDYSLMNTVRHALYLPTAREVKYEGKTAIDSFFWRFGDLLQAGVIYAGVTWFDFGVRAFVLMNLGLGFVWLGLSVIVGREFGRMTRQNAPNVAPVLARAIPDHAVAPSSRFAFELAQDTFTDQDPGDVITLSARVAGSERLPRWLRFDAAAARFSGIAPERFEALDIRVVATDLEGLEAVGSFRLSPA